MRADRLVAVVMLLQRRGRVTAAEVAAELEISERTARRDLDALAVAGVPVVSTVGRGGGWELVGGARTDLSGLREAEARALFAAAGPAVASTPELRSALRKLVAALPEPFRDAAETASRSVMAEPTGWGSAAPGEAAGSAGDHLEVVQQALFGRRRLDLSYVDRRGAASQRTVDPYGLVAKAGRWYLVAGTDRGRRTFRLDRMAAARVRDDEAVVPDDFDLREAWAAIATDVDALRSPATVELAADSAVVDLLGWLFPGQMEQQGPTADGHRIRLRVRGWSHDLVARQLAGFGAAVEVLDPPAARRRLARLGAELSARYARD